MKSRNNKYGRGGRGRWRKRRKKRVKKRREGEGQEEGKERTSGEGGRGRGKREDRRNGRGKREEEKDGVGGQGERPRRSTSSIMCVALNKHFGFCNTNNRVFWKWERERAEGVCLAWCAGTAAGDIHGYTTEGKSWGVPADSPTHPHWAAQQNPAPARSAQGQFSNVCGRFRLQASA